MVPQLFIRRHRHAPHITVGGSIDSSSAQALGTALARDVRTMAHRDDTIELDFVQLELDGGSAVVEAVRALRELVRETRVILKHAPSTLVDTLRRDGLLSDGRLELQTPRG